MRKKLSAIFLCFLAYAIIGWCYEVFLEVFIYKWGFSNRGFLFGPYCPVYGFGTLLLLFCLKGVKEKRKWYSPILVFLGTVLITTSVELLTSYIMEFAIGGWMWDYTKYTIQFDGRIALNPSIRFGLGGLFFLYAVQPLLEKLAGYLGEKTCMKLSGVLFFIVLIDFISTMVYRVL
ncbi:MAG: putative ABC transporter permease [Anaerotignum sp.]|nr:putative ABC transporter permease [Anaerotignum sp.]